METRVTVVHVAGTDPAVGGGDEPIPRRFAQAGRGREHVATVRGRVVVESLILPVTVPLGFRI
jgi:hypothetical protein